MSFNQIFSRLTRIARSYGSAGHGSTHDDLRRAQELIDEARSREEASRWEAALVEEEDQMSYRRACTTLELRPGASLDEASMAYRRIIMAVHPDRTAHLPEREKERARLRTQELNHAYAIIKEHFAPRHDG